MRRAGVGGPGVNGPVRSEQLGCLLRIQQLHVGSVEALQAREVVKAEIKQRQDEYNATRNQTQAPAAATGGASGFNF